MRTSLLSIRERASGGLAIAVAIASSGACTTSRSSGDAGATRPADALAEAAASAGAVAADAGSEPDTAAAPTIVGEWERETEPYRGMRVAIRAGERMRAVVTAPPPVTQERLSFQARSAPMAVAKAQLECQRSLWKTGEELVTRIDAAGAGGFQATILVRDWGLSGVCRHADSRAPARLVVSPDGGELAVAVTRGKTVTQRWRRVGP